MNKSTVFNYVFEQVRNYVHQIKEGHITHLSDTYATRVGARSHLCSIETNKCRAIFIASFAEHIIELMFYWPLHAYLKSKDSIIAWNYETSRGGTAETFRRFTTGSMLSLD